MQGLLQHSDGDGTRLGLVEPTAPTHEEPRPEPLGARQRPAPALVGPDQRGEWFGLGGGCMQICWGGALADMGGACWGTPPVAQQQQTRRSGCRNPAGHSSGQHCTLQQEEKCPLGCLYRQRSLPHTHSPCTGVIC